MYFHIVGCACRTGRFKYLLKSSQNICFVVVVIYPLPTNSCDRRCCMRKQTNNERSNRMLIDIQQTHTHTMTNRLTE